MARRNAFAPSVSGLEDRNLMAGSIGFDGGTLALYSDVGASVAELSPSETTPGNVVATIDGVSREFTAAEVKLVVFYSSAEGGDSFVNNTDETTISDLAGTGNAIVGGTGTDYVIDYGGSAEVDDQGGGLLYLDASQGQGRGYSVRTSPRTGQVIVRVY